MYWYTSSIKWPRCARASARSRYSFRYTSSSFKAAKIQDPRLAALLQGIAAGWALTRDQTLVALPVDLTAGGVGRPAKTSIEDTTDGPRLVVEIAAPPGDAPRQILTDATTALGLASRYVPRLDPPLTAGVEARVADAAGRPLYALRAHWLVRRRGARVTIVAAPGPGVAKALLSAEYPDTYRCPLDVSATADDRGQTFADLSQQLSRKAEPASLQRQAAAALTRGNNQSAISALSRLIDLRPEDADAYLDRGRAYYYEGDYEPAIQELTRGARASARPLYGARVPGAGVCGQR